MVHDQPIQAELRHDVCERLELDWLLDVAVDTESVGGGHVSILLRGREHNDRGVPELTIRPNRTEDLDAVHLRQLEVEEDDPRVLPGVSTVVISAREQEVEGL